MKKSYSDWLSIFDKLARKHDTTAVFADWLTLLRMWLTVPYPESEAQQVLRRYTEDDRQILSQLYQSYFASLPSLIEEHGWNDFIGTVYETMTSQSKSQRLGQFFTPESVVDAMTALTMGITAYHLQHGFSVSDPCCGSGRTLMAVHAYCIKQNGENGINNFYHAIDIDSMAVNMCCINMAVHGMRATVIHGDALAQKFHAQYEINPYLNETNGLPHIKEVTPHANGHMQLWEESRGLPIGQTEARVEAEPIPEPIKIPKQDGTQLTLW